MEFKPGCEDEESDDKIVYSEDYALSMRSNYFMPCASVLSRVLPLPPSGDSRRENVPKSLF